MDQREAKSGSSSDSWSCDMENDLGLTQIALESNTAADESQPPTLYDPAAAAVSPHAEDKVGMGLVPEKAYAELVTSPASPAVGLDPFAVDSDEGEEEQETPVCCFGLIPLKSATYVFNFMNIIMGLAAIAYSISRLNTTPAPTEGMETTNVLLISGPRIFDICCLMVGILLVLLGALGMYLASDIVALRIERRRKVLYLILQVYTVCVMFVLFFFLVVSSVALGAVRATPVYTQVNWEKSVQSGPAQICHRELAYGCAAFNTSQCVDATAPETYANCPGHFCTSFCRVNTENINENDICSGCIESQETYNFTRCAEHEATTPVLLGCEEAVNRSLEVSYTWSLIVSLTAFLWVVATMFLASYRACCVAPSE